MPILDLPFRLLISLVIGAVVGLERETHRHAGNKIGGSVGLRSFSLISTLGTLAGFLYLGNLPLFIFISAVFGLIVVSYYLLQSKTSKDIGITTEIGMLFTYVAGILIGIFLYLRKFENVQLLNINYILEGGGVEGPRKVSGETCCCCCWIDDGLFINPTSWLSLRRRDHHKICSGFG